MDGDTSVQARYGPRPPHGASAEHREGEDDDVRDEQDRDERGGKLGPLSVSVELSLAFVQVRRCMADRQTIFVGFALFTSAATALGLAIEVLALVLNSQGLVDRLRAYRAGQEALNAFDAPWNYCAQFMIPHTDYPPTPGGLVTGSLWRCLRAVALILTLVGEIPAGYAVGRVGSWLLISSAASGCAYAGFVLLIESLSILSLPVYVHGHDLGLFQWVSAWIIMAAALLDILLGWLFGTSIRWRRGQISKPGKTVKPKKVLVEKYDAFIAAIQNSYLDHAQAGQLWATIKVANDAFDEIRKSG